MKRQVIYLIIILGILMSCFFTRNSESGSPSEFLELFQDISCDNLHLYSPCDKAEGNKFEGQLIDSTFHKFFMFDKWLKTTFDYQNNIFSCFKFKLSDTETGLIIRRLSQYSESAIDMCIWDKQTESIIKRIELADTFGDGTWYFVKDAWITDINEDGYLDIVTRKMEWWEDDVESTTENPQGVGEIHTSDTLKTYLSNSENYKLTSVKSTFN
jgi:hypothetical protein